MKADAQLKSDVEPGLAGDQRVASPHLLVEASHGVVTRTGRVASLAGTSAAEEAADRASGLRALAAVAG